MSNPRFPWSSLGIGPTADVKAIRAAYAARIKAMDIDREVDAYARLRDARDAALRLARGMASPPDAAALEPTVATPEPPAPAAPEWPHAAPLLPGEWQADPLLSTRIAPLGEAPLAVRLAPDLRVTDGLGEHQALATDAGQPFVAPLVEGHARAAGIDAPPAQSPFTRLAALLDPEHAPDTTPLDEAQEARAQAALRQVLDLVHQSGITAQQEMEDWLADLLAQAWPRSAPLLETAAEAFAWQQEWGKIDARPAVDYLGSRLRGYRFERKVREKDHRYHRAWAELRRPGPAGPLRFLRANGADVRALLAGIRRRFPEVEQRLDADRVASWEKGSAWLTVVMVVFFIGLAGILSTLNEPSRDHRAGSAAQSWSIEQASTAAVREAFGADHGLAWLREQDALLAATVEGHGRNAVLSGKGSAAAVDQTVELVRQRMFLQGRLTSGEDFERTMHLRLDLLEAARGRDPATCVRYLSFGTLSGSTPVPAATRAAERSLASTFAERNLLGLPAASDTITARVPASLVAQVRDTTGLTRDAVAQALQGKGPDAERCDVAIALLDAALAWRGDQRRAILQTL
ncbi:hypothetical protein [Novosphingobium soli]|uniref:J domain-containing protein n=1 Tax=Novosphingobium soli TaxID=574956 RepID=A0ABV6CPI7_9SPHN